jgi:glucosamine--fructose-6-phosphate aminotransferase (isomerizing)
MCGIVGVIGSRPAAPLILDALRRLEYRGYDSAGIATLVNGHIDRRRAEGKLGNLAAALDRTALPGSIGIGHTRWATHGAPTESNAHPHGTALVSLVHNGIIENHAELRAELEAEGQAFSTETDTETVAQLVDLNLKRGMKPIEAAGAALRRLEGAYALAMIFAGHPELIVGAQRGAPLAVGFGDDEMFVGSDALALAPLTRRIAYLRDGDWTVVDRKGAQFFDIDGNQVQREIKETRMSGAAIGKGNFRHFMEKELHEHPAVIGDTLHQMISPGSRAVALPDLGIDFARVPRITMSACGSAFYAGLVGRWWFEAVSRIPTDGDVASEFRYRTPPMPRGGLGLLVSQSGETADTLAALRYMREQDQTVLSILNVPESTMARESHAVLETVAGPEIGVASTKAFTAQLSVLACLAIAAGRATGAISADREAAMTAALLEVPGRAAEVLAGEAAILSVAHRVAKARDVLFLGRGNCFPIALERRSPISTRRAMPPVR